MFGKKGTPKPVEVPQEEAKPKFKPFDADDYKAKSLSAKYAVEITLRDGDKMQITRDIHAYPHMDISTLHFGPNREVTHWPATEFDLIGKLRDLLKEIGKDGLFLNAEDVNAEDKASFFVVGHYIPPANIVGLAYRKLEG